MHLPVVHYGPHAGLGLQYLLYNARKQLRKGDVVLLLPEYELLSSQNVPSWTLAAYVMKFDPGFLLHRPLVSVQLVRKLTPDEHWKRFRDRWTGVLVDGQIYRDQLNGYGDLLSNASKNVPAEAKTRVAGYTTITLWDGGITAHAESEISAFAEWCRANGVHLLGEFQPFFRFENLRSGQEHRTTEQLLALYKKEDITAVGKPEEFLFGRERLFDSYNHLDREGAGEMASRLLSPVRGALETLAYLQRRLPVESGAATALDMSARNLSPFVEDMEGFSVREPWGRWTVGKHASIHMKHPLPPAMTLHLDVLDALPEKCGLPFKVRIGNEERSFTVEAPGQSYALKFLCQQQCPRRIDFEAPDVAARKTAADDRDLSLALMRLRIVPTAP